MPRPVTRACSVLSIDLDTDVCWIDLSWTSPHRRASRHPPPPGISEVLRGSKTIDDVMYADLFQPRVKPVPLGDLGAGDQSRLARSAQLTEVINELLRRHDHIVIDAGAVLESTEALASIRHGGRVHAGGSAWLDIGPQVRTVADELTDDPVARRAPESVPHSDARVHPQPFRPVKPGS